MTVGTCCNCDNKAPVLVGESRAIREIVELVDTVAQSDCCVLVEGESGTGKELVVQRLHASSRRKDGPLIPVNCAGVSETLFESQFFGHVRGAFTGAEKTMLGLVRSADGGTLFMDEIGEIPLHLQPKLLRVLQSGEVMPVGLVESVATDTRFVAATNRDLYQEVLDGTFREDLYYRLNIVRIVLPPLRERIEDLDPLLDHFIAGCAKRYKLPAQKVPISVRQMLSRHDWPGNVRELFSWVERLYATRQDPADLATRLLADTRRKPKSSDDTGKIETLAQAERRAVEAAMAVTGGRVEEAALLLQVHRSTLSRKIKEYSEN